MLLNKKQKIQLYTLLILASVVVTIEMLVELLAHLVNSSSAATTLEEVSVYLAVSCIWTVGITLFSMRPVQQA